MARLVLKRAAPAPMPTPSAPSTTATLPVTPRWRDLERKGAALVKRRRSDRFLKSVVAGALMAARQKRNPIRGNLAAAALRELIGHLLHGLAPDSEVRACAWYKQVPDTDGPTRRQRANFIAHGGLTPAFVRSELKFSVKAMTDPLLATMTELNRRTHVREGTVLSDGKAVRRLCGDVLDAVAELLDAADECRSAVEHALRDSLDQAVMDRLIGETIAELDELSSHTFIEGHLVEEIEVVEIGPELTTFSVRGEVFVTLQYGSGSDVRRGQGAVMGDSYPYKATVRVKSARPSEFLDDPEIGVDTTSFYE